MMRVDRQSSNASYTEQSPLQRITRTRPPLMQDSISSYPPLEGEEKRSPLKIVVDCLLCIRAVIWMQIRKIFSLFFYRKYPTPEASAPEGQSGGRRPHPPVNDAENFFPDDFIPDSLSTIEEDDEEEASVHEQNLSLSQLNLNDEEKDHIVFIINTLAKESAFKMPTLELRRRGEALSHLHPFIYLKFVLCNVALFADFKVMKTRSFGIVWSQYADEFSGKLQDLHKLGVLLPYLKSFAQDTGRDYEVMKRMIETSAFRSFTDYLIEDPTSTVSTPSSDHSSASSTSVPFSPRKRELVPLTAVSSPPRSSAANGYSPPSTLERQQSLRRQRTVKSRDVGPSSPQKRTTIYSGSPVLSERPLSSSSTGRSPFSREATAAAQNPDDIESSAAQSLSRSLNPADLLMPEIHKQKLAKIFEEVAHGSALNLIWQITSIKSDWSKLKEVHPLRLLLEVFNNPAHVANLSLILQSSMRKDYFMTDFALTLKAGATKEMLVPYIEEFCRQMGVEGQLISNYLMVGGEWDWKHVIKYILGKKQLEASSVFTNI